MTDDVVPFCPFCSLCLFESLFKCRTSHKQLEARLASQWSCTTSRKLCTAAAKSRLGMRDHHICRSRTICGHQIYHDNTERYGIRSFAPSVITSSATPSHRKIQYTCSSSRCTKKYTNPTAVRGWLRRFSANLPYRPLASQSGAIPAR